MGSEISAEEFMNLAGKELAPSSWITLSQERVNQFANCTDDRQFIHTDPERMKDTELGTTIAHRFLSLSLTSAHGPEDWPTVQNTRMLLNYGLDKVRFICPVKVGSRVRFLTKIESIVEKKPGHLLVKAVKTLEVEGQADPAMIAETLGMIVLDLD